MDHTTARRPARAAVLASAAMVLGMGAVTATLGLVFVFFVIFPVLVQGLIAFSLAQVMGERAENQEYVARRRARRQ
jgi:hypothetical protein